MFSFILLTTSCNNSINKIFARKTPHEAYARKIEDDSLRALWIDASNKALIMSQPVELPYKITGYFHVDKPRALALLFKAKHGQRINFEVAKKQVSNFILFADLYRQEGTEWKHLLAVDTLDSVFAIDVEETNNYLLRIQPGLNQEAEYELSASISPSLGFPIAGSKGKTGSFWGDDRDGGKRNHEGIDIFAAKRTPVIAATDGYITRVAEGGIGGKTIWVRAKSYDIHLYYAHLDSQMVSDGQMVKKGDTLGLVGNTGNARFTPPHLHFGVYTSQGPIDPLPFVDRDIKTATSVNAKHLKELLVLKNPRLLKEDSLKPGTVLVPLARTKSGYIGELADGNVVHVPAAAVSPVSATSLSNKNNPVNGGG